MAQGYWLANWQGYIIMENNGKMLNKKNVAKAFY